MSTLDRNKPTRNNRLRLVTSGLRKHFPNAQFVLAGQTFNNTSDLIALIQKDIDAMDTADRARAAFLAQVKVQNDVHASVAPVLRALRGYVMSHFGDTTTVGESLSDFGYSPRKLTTRSVDDKATAAAKNRATRVARHTMGPKKRKEVTGETTPAAPPPASTSATPAATTPPAGSPPVTSPQHNS